MRRLGRFALLSITAFVLSVQGVAAGTIRLCGVLHSSAAERSARAPDPAVHPLHCAHHRLQVEASQEDAPVVGGERSAHSPGSAPGHPSAALSGAVSDFDAGTGVAVPEPTDSEVHACKACAYCSLGAVLPAAGVSPGVLASPVAGFASLPIALAGFLTDGPDRPPRTSLA